MRLTHFLAALSRISSFEKIIGLVIVDCATSVLSLLLAFVIFALPRSLLTFKVTLTILSLRLAIFGIVGMYRILLRYASIRALLTTINAVILTQMSLILTNWLLNFGLPNRVFLLDGIFMLLLTGGIRLTLRIIRELLINQSSDQKVTPILIIGAGDGAELIAREINRSAHFRHYDIKGYLDDDPHKWGGRLHGVYILGPIDTLRSTVEELEIEEVIIAIPSASGKVIRKIIEQCDAIGLKYKITPPIYELNTGRARIGQLRQVNIEDLLGRQILEKELAVENKTFLEEVVLVTGAGGSIGSELCRQIRHLLPRKIILFDHSEHALYQIDYELNQIMNTGVKLVSVVGDIKNMALLNQVLSQHKVTSIFHAAAYKHVPLMEQNVAAVIENNILGTQNLVAAAIQNKIKKFILISTDKAVNPSSVMGASKRVCEMIIQAQKGDEVQFSAVRFGNVLGSNGSVVPLFQKQILEGGPITITHPDVTRYFMTIPEAVCLVIQAAHLSTGKEVFILDMGQPVKILNLAKDLIKLSGVEDDEIEIVYTGLRSGEKMHEELIYPKEELFETSNAKIGFIVPQKIDAHLLEEKIAALTQMTESEAQRDALIELANYGYDAE